MKDKKHLGGKEHAKLGTIVSKEISRVVIGLECHVSRGGKVICKLSEPALHKVTEAVKVQMFGIESPIHPELKGSPAAAATLKGNMGDATHSPALAAAPTAALGAAPPAIGLGDTSALKGAAHE